MDCIKCKIKLADGSIYCHMCGKKQVTQKGTGKRKRGNGQGSVYKAAGAKSWTAAKVLGYETRDNGKVLPIIDKKSGFPTKTDALEYLPNLGRGAKKIDKSISFKGIYNLWLPEYQRRGRSKKTEDGYKSAFRHYRDIWFIPFYDIGIDDLQECVDNCPHGKRTRELMKVVGNLLYGYAIPRGYTDDGVNKASFIFPGGQKGAGRIAFSEKQVAEIKEHIGKVDYADWIYCHCYLGFRPHEFVSLDIANYDRDNKYIVGGEKTEAGIDRPVTISPKIIPIIESVTRGRNAGPIFCDADGNPVSLKTYREDYFYSALADIGIDNPINPDTGIHMYTPHCCRHTFATMMKNVVAPAKDKLSLIGHTSEEMLSHYQHPNLDDLRKITDQI